MEYDFSIGMALVDFIPVVLFAIAAVIFQRCFYNKMSKGAFALYSAGTISVVVAGFCKALWKFLYAANICDFEKFNHMFFPLQSLGFLLAAAGAIALLTFPQKDTREKTLSPAVVSGTMLFVGFNVAGVFVLTFAYSYFAKKLKKPGLIVLFVLAAIFNLMMGYLSTKTFEQAYMNWAAELVNTIGQGLLLLGAIGLKKAGLEDYKM